MAGVCVNIIAQCYILSNFSYVKHSSSTVHVAIFLCTIYTIVADYQEVSQARSRGTLIKSHKYHMKLIQAIHKQYRIQSCIHYA